MNHSECARRWAEQSGRGNKAKAGAIFYEGDTIYSYGHHYPIARHVVLKDSRRRITLHNSNWYSNSTNRHSDTVWWAAATRNSGIERDTQYRIEGDEFDNVKTEASLRNAIKLTEQHRLDRAYEARIYRTERAAADRKCNANTARQELEALLDLDLTDMSDSFAVKLRNLLCGVAKNNFRVKSYRRSGLVECAPQITEFLHDILPERIKAPGEVLTLIENFKQLAA